jgi:hypothetical protein
MARATQYVNEREISLTWLCYAAHTAEPTLNGRHLKLEKQMKTLNELRAFCEGYRLALIVERNFHSETLASADDWVVWDEYDINFAGADYSSHAKTNSTLRVDVYKAGWTDSIGEPIHSFTVWGETE